MKRWKISGVFRKSVTQVRGGRNEDRLCLGRKVPGRGTGSNPFFEILRPVSLVYAGGCRLG